MASTTPRINYEPLLWLGLGATFFLTARLIGRHLAEAVYLNEISEDDELHEPNAGDSSSNPLSPASARRKKPNKFPEDRISLDILRQLAFSSSYDIREATNKIVAERWARNWNCKHSLFVDLESECALIRDEGDFIVNVLRDYNIDPEPRRSQRVPGLQTLEEVLEHALLDSNSIPADANQTTVTTVDQGSNAVESALVLDLTRGGASQRTGDVLSSAQAERPRDDTGDDFVAELHRTRSHVAGQSMDDVWTARHHGEDDEVNNDDETLPEMPHPRFSSIQSPEEIERRRGRREAVVIGLETENGEAETVRVVRPGADTLEFQVRRASSASRARNRFPST